MSRFATELRLFLTCWVVFSLYFATDFVREHFLVVSMVDEHTFDLEKYYGMHPDIFRNPSNAPAGGTHHGANPGMSMVGAIPYLMLKPIVDRVVARELAHRPPSSADTAAYRDPRAKRQFFYKRARELGVDVRFALASLITMVFCMGPLSALSAVVILRLLLGIGFEERAALWLSLAYAFCTPMVFRTAFLNQNLGIGIFSLLAFALLWDPGRRTARSARDTAMRFAGAGFLGGLCFLCDYSGALSLGLLGLYALARARDDQSWPGAFRLSFAYAVGAILPVVALWYYQWASFGNWLLPPQQWMPPVEWIEVGYKGVGGPQLDLFWLLLAEPRYGLFTFAPVLLLALLWPVYARRGTARVPRREAVFCVGLTLAYLVFFSAVQYTRLQWVTGLRYVMPVVPFLFLLAADVLRQVPRPVAWIALAVGLVVDATLAMTRSQRGVLDAISTVLRDGPMLPSVTTLSKMSVQYLPVAVGRLAFALHALAIVLLVAIWSVPRLRLAARKAKVSPSA